MNDDDTVLGTKKLDTKQYKIRHEDFIASPDSIYDQFKYTGAYNLTGVLRAPIFLTKKYFLDVDDVIGKNVQIMGNDGLEKNSSRADDIELQIQSDTGIPISINATIQINLEIPNDSLFSPYHHEKTADSTLWPVFT